MKEGGPSRTRDAVCHHRRGGSERQRRLLADRCLRRGPLADVRRQQCVRPALRGVPQLLFREGGTAYLPFSFCWPVRAELGEVFVAELPEWELAAVLHGAAWAIMWDWADRSKWPNQASPD